MSKHVNKEALLEYVADLIERKRATGLMAVLDGFTGWDAPIKHHEVWRTLADRVENGETDPEFLRFVQSFADLMKQSNCTTLRDCPIEGIDTMCEKPYEKWERERDERIAARKQAEAEAAVEQEQDAA